MRDSGIRDSYVDPDLVEGCDRGNEESRKDLKRAPKKRCIDLPKRKKMNVACKVEHFVDIVSYFCSRKKELVRQMGFGSFLGLKFSSLDRRFCMWLYDKFDPETGSLVLNANTSERMPLRPSYVSWILGLPMNGDVVPTSATNLSEEDEEEVQRLQEKYQVNNKVNNQVIKGLDWQTIEDDLLKQRILDDDFKKAFLLFLLGCILCPTQSTRISADLLAPALVASKSRNYAWGEFVYNWLMNSGTRFSKDKKVAGPQGAGGCALVLMIAYLDRKPLPPRVNWYRMPRILAWCHKSLEQAIECDRISDNEYGKAMFYTGVDYGKPHPSESSGMPWPWDLQYSWAPMFVPCVSVYVPSDNLMATGSKGHSNNTLKHMARGLDVPENLSLVVKEKRESGSQMSIANNSEQAADTWEDRLMEEGRLCVTQDAGLDDACSSAEKTKWSPCNFSRGSRQSADDILHNSRRRRKCKQSKTSKDPDFTYPPTRSQRLTNLEKLVLKFVKWCDLGKPSRVLVKVHIETIQLR